MKIAKHHIETIVNRAIKASFTDREASPLKKEQALAIKCYKSIFPSDLLKKVNAIPTNWFRSDSCFRFTVRGQYHVLNHEKAHPVPFNNHHGCSTLGELKDELADDVIAFSNEKADIKKEKESARYKLTATLSNISTFAKLQELWPEGKEFYLDLDEDAKTKNNLPAIRFDDINAMFNLKKAD